MSAITGFTVSISSVASKDSSKRASTPTRRARRVSIRVIGAPNPYKEPEPTGELIATKGEMEGSKKSAEIAAQVLESGRRSPSPFMLD